MIENRNRIPSPSPSPIGERDQKFSFGKIVPMVKQFSNHQETITYKLYNANFSKFSNSYHVFFIAQTFVHGMDLILVIRCIKNYAVTRRIDALKWQF